MDSITRIKQFIQQCFPKWEKVDFSEYSNKIDFRTDLSELYRIPDNDVVLISYTNISITGTERQKPQLRVFLDEYKKPFYFAKKYKLRYFLFSIFTKDDEMARGLDNFNPKEYIISIETNLDNETSRRDLRSIYDFANENLNNRKFLKCLRSDFNAEINQASFIYIGIPDNPDKETFENFMAYFDSRPYQQSLDYSQNINPSSLKTAEKYEQVIYYGVPGSGKSYKIDNEKTCGASDVQKQKVVFHPDYTNADFVGQIVPKMKESGEGENKKSMIEYSFKPGPFTIILRRALRDKSHQYFLIIEEINRGNAAAIFGDLFQLLDRDDDGWSCSPVNNDDINFYVASEYEFWEERYSESHQYDAERVNSPNGTESFCRNSGLRLPPNLSIYATMNTNDQNVFMLDNAFNRRFKSEYISNKEDPRIQEHCEQYNLKIGETKIYWGVFRNLVNERIIESGFANAEDKQLGLFFIKKENDSEIVKSKDFADKVLKYLWHDVFKRNRDIFNGENISKFEDLIENFSGEDALEKCFASDFVYALKERNCELAFTDAETPNE